MSEYGERHTVARLIGAPPGYIGYGEGGQLTEPVRRRPYSVVLFDEVEKAHPDVWNTLLQVLDDGRLTDGQGNVVDFKNTVVILTSNLGTSAAAEIGDRRDLDNEQKRERIQQAVMDEVRHSFRPEFINRLDEIVVFNRLEREHLEAIVEIQLEIFARRIARRGLGLSVTAAAKSWLLAHGWEPQYGARPLKRAIQHYVQDEMARRLLGGEVAAGDTVLLDARGDALTFVKAC
jgi:ATP-dependent Clp protease ATP-binding subunit ClpB